MKKESKSKKYMFADYLDLKLYAIEHFLEHVCEGCTQEMKQIERKNEGGCFKEFSDYEHAVDYPLMREKLVIRSVYYELSSLIEHELQQLAHPIWRVSKKFKGPKDIPELLNSSKPAANALKMISDLKFFKIKELIEEYYQIKIAQIPESQSIFRIRDIVNSFKHRKGFKDFRKTGSLKVNILDQYSPTIEEAYDAIEQTKTFIRALWAAIKNKSK